MSTKRYGLVLVTFSATAFALASCGDPAPTGPPTAPSAPASAATDAPDPVVQAILGSAQRAIQNRHPGAAIVMADEALSKTTADRTICGRYIALKHSWQGRRYFIASASELAVVENGSRRWTETCEGAQPLPGALTGPAVEAAVQAAAGQAIS